MFRPKLIDSLRGYSPASLRADLLAGLTVGIVALPLAIGFGIASGASPGAGLTAAIIGGFIVSALGGSRVQIGGPAGAFVALLYTLSRQYGPQDLLACTAMAGVILFLFGAFRLGNLIRFVPHPVTTGFTCGIAVTIVLSQAKDFLGLPLAVVPAEFGPKMIALARALPGASGPTLAVGGLAIVVIVAWPRRWARYVPGSIVAILAGTALARGLSLPVETIASRFGDAGIPQGLPPPRLLPFAWADFPHLVRPAFAIAVLGSIESLLSAVVADGMIDNRHDSNQELMAQGVANLITPLFGGIPVTGVIARTATNIRHGAVSPVAGIVHSLTLLVIVLLAAPLAAHIPLAVLGAVLVVVALRMGEWSEFLLLGRQARSDAVVFLLTFALTVIFDLSVAVEVGMILAAFLFIRRVAETTQVVAHDEGSAATQGHETVTDLPAGVLVFRVFGALLFGAADKLDGVIRRAGSDTRVVILNLSAMTALDGTALNLLQTLHEKLRHHGRHLILCGLHTQPFFLMEKSGFNDRVGAENVVPTLEAAVDRARALLRAG